MLAAINLTPVMDLADLEPVLEQMGKRPHAKADAAGSAAIPAPIDLRPDAPPVELRNKAPMEPSSR